jgi:hypothetical protein
MEGAESPEADAAVRAQKADIAKAMSKRFGLRNFLSPNLRPAGGIFA